VADQRHPYCAEIDEPEIIQVDAADRKNKQKEI